VKSFHIAEESSLYMTTLWAPACKVISEGYFRAYV